MSQALEQPKHPSKQSMEAEPLHIPISPLAFADAGYNTVHFLFPSFGSSEAKTLPVAEEQESIDTVKLDSNICRGQTFYPTTKFTEQNIIAFHNYITQ